MDLAPVPGLQARAVAHCDVGHSLQTIDIEKGPNPIPAVAGGSRNRGRSLSAPSVLANDRCVKLNVLIRQPILCGPWRTGNTTRWPPARFVRAHSKPPPSWVDSDRPNRWQYDGSDLARGDTML